MPDISKRGITIPPSPIRKLKPLADQARESGKHIYHLNIGQPDIPTPKAFMNGMKKSNIQVLSYSPSQGLDEAVKAYLSYYRHMDINLTREELIVTVGGSEAVIFSFLAALNSGDEIIIPEPFYPNYRGYSVLAGLNIVPITTKLEGGFHVSEREEIEEKITKKTKAILITNPNNPTGVVYSPEEIKTLGKIALKYDLFLIADEVYREFLYGENDHLSVLKLEGLEKHAILVDSISKRFSACGARIGCLASRNKEFMRSVLKMAQARLSPPTAGQLGMIKLINSSDWPRQVTEMIDKYRNRRDLVYSRLEQMGGVSCSKPEGAFYMVAKLPVRSAENFVRWLLIDFDLDGETVMLAPLEGFYQTPGLGVDEVRIGYVLNRKSLDRSMSIIEEALQRYKTYEDQKIKQVAEV